MEDKNLRREYHGSKSNSHQYYKMKALGVEGLCTGKFAENLTTEGIELYKLPVGTKLEIGETIQEVTQIGKECHTKCAIYHQVGNCVMPTDGIFTKVLKEGTVRPGDIIRIIE
ncbi:MAG: molybdenum cofactor sulfurase [Clostridia bacterium]|nr:molybdenum cofactor sulfurase [Clostridia bacterium]